jgi:threonine dehydratase
MISAQQIRSTYRIIGPHIRRTPIIEVDGADLGLDTAPLVLKLESLQHAGSFKARGERSLGRPDRGAAAVSREY